MGFLGERFIFRVGVFADRGMLPGLARTIALTTIRTELSLQVTLLFMRAFHSLSEFQTLVNTIRVPLIK